MVSEEDSYIHKRVQLKSKPDRPQHDRQVACVIAQHYSSGTFVSLRFHSRKEKLSSRLKEVIISPFICFFKILKLNN
jgi:hypothetical protein